MGTESWCDMSGAHDGADADESMAEYRTGATATGALPSRLPSLDFEHSRSPSERGEGEMAAMSSSGSARARVQQADRHAPISRQDSYTSTGSSTLTTTLTSPALYAYPVIVSRSDAGAAAGTKRSRSGRQIAPKLTLLEAMEPPLLKWEKEQQQRDKKHGRSAGHGTSAKMGAREAGAPYDTDSGDGLVDDVLRASGLTPPALDLRSVQRSPPKRSRV